MFVSTLLAPVCGSICAPPPSSFRVSASRPNWIPLSISMLNGRVSPLEDAGEALRPSRTRIARHRGGGGNERDRRGQGRGQGGSCSDLWHEQG